MIIARSQITKLLFIPIFVLAFSIFLAFTIFAPGVEAQNKSKDAIAIRIIPNPNNYSPKRWYTENKFKGSPQALIVDGYEAIRDGRTVYVGASNISGDKLFTNIYLISFNQDAEQATEDIFSQIISHWKFNTNIGNLGKCRKNPSDPINVNAQKCLIDTDCQEDMYCDSQKAWVIRDTKRLADLQEIKISLADYKNKAGSFPILKSGSYLPGVTISTWPSWQKLLSQELKMELPLDPVNKLGACSEERFYSATCWDEKAKEFDDVDLANQAINLPDDSKVYLYTADEQGKKYDICATMESPYVSGTSSGACSVDKSVIYDAEVVNNPPKFVSYDLKGSPNEVFSGYIHATDPDGHSLTWSIDTSGVDWTGDNWSEAPYLSGTISEHKNIKSGKTGKEGVYNISVTISDAYDSVTKVFQIVISTTPPEFTPANAVLFASTTNSVTHTFKAWDKAANMPLSIKSINPALPNGLSAVMINNFDNTFTFKLSGYLDDSNFIPGAIINSYDLQIENSVGGVKEDSFNITITNEKPIIAPPACANVVRINNPYNCQVSASDHENNAIDSYSFQSAPNNLLISNSGTITGAPSVSGNFNIQIKATDEYGAESDSQTLSLTVNTYCGDGVWQALNDERIGGSFNVGDEVCDGLQGIGNINNSNVNKQYACALNCTPTGGYCGDGIVQDGTGGTLNVGENFDDGTGSACQSVCGDGVVNGVEECEGAQTLPCNVVVPGFPAHCDPTFIGTQSCVDCEWGSCVAPVIDEINETSTDCGSTDVFVNDYTCCELVGCVQDGCSCCGRLEAEIGFGYTNKQSFDVSWDPAKIGTDPWDGFSSCGDMFPNPIPWAGWPVFPSEIPGNSVTNGCRVNESDVNSRNWQITTDHSTAKYRCWR